MRNGDYDNKWWLRPVMMAILIGFSKKTLCHFSEDVFLIFFSCGKKQSKWEKKCRTNETLDSLHWRNREKRNSTLLKGSVVNLFFWEFFAFQSVIFFQNDSYNFEMKETNQSIKQNFLLLWSHERFFQLQIQFDVQYLQYTLSDILDCTFRFCCCRDCKSLKYIGGQHLL